MDKKIWFVLLVVLVVAVGLIAFLPGENSNSSTNLENNELNAQGQQIQETAPNPKPANNEPKEINYQNYNFQFAEGRVLGELDRLIGSNGKFAFYLPPTDYIEVESGTNYGVAFALNNPNPSGENYFEYEFRADENTCAKNEWMKMGFKSFGKIPQGWVDKMTVYFEFPQGEPCVAKYNFEVTKDGTSYGSKVLEFRIK